MSFENENEYVPLSGVNLLPVHVTFLVFGNYFIVDPTITEEKCGNCSLRFFINHMMLVRKSFFFFF